MGILDYFIHRPAPLTLSHGPARDAAADAASRVAEHEIEARVAARFRAFADADVNTFWHVDPVSNPNTGLLGPQDALSGTIPTAYGWFLTDSQLSQLYALQIARTICTEQPAWLAAAGHRITTEDGDDQMSGVDDAYGVSIAFADAHGRANHLRGAGILLDVDEDGDPPLSEPLDPAKVRRINKLVVYGGLLLQVADWQNDAEGEPGLLPIWRKFARPAQPRTFRLLPTFRQGGIPLDRGGGSGVIHWTRILYFQGASVPPDVDGMMAAPSTHYCLSKLDLCWRSIRRWMTTATNAERIANTHGAWVMTIGNKAALDTSATMNPGSGGLGWVDRMISFFNARKVFVGMPGDTVATAGVDLGGWDKMEQGAYIDLANTSEIPVPLLFESLPAGFTAGNDTWEPQWHGRCSTAFRTKWAANLARFYILAYYVRTQRAPRLLKVDHGPWRDPTDEERQKVRTDKANELSTLLAANVITRDEARTCYEPTFTVEMQVQPAPVLADAADGVLVALSIDPASIAALQQRVAARIPGFRREPWPHLTLYYAGAVPARALPQVERVAFEMRDGWPAEIEGLEVGPLGDDGAIVLFVRRGGLDGRQREMAARMARVNRADQFPRYVPHVTLGYGDLAGVDLSEMAATIRAEALVVRTGEREVVRWPIG
jgi:2'-5' RNA ligase